MIAFVVLLAFRAAAVDPEFVDARRVTISGYSGDAMEPFISRDGRYLFFNNSNAKPSETDLQWAERVDDLTFAYRGALPGANSPALDAVASMDRNGNVFFVSTRNYDRTLTTVFRGRFQSGALYNVRGLSAISSRIRGQLIFDVEVSADGEWLYFAEGVFNGGSVPVSADIGVAARDAFGRFRRVDTTEFAAINTPALEYAPSISEDRLEFFFTRVVGGVPAIFRSTRPNVDSAWGTPRRLAAITGFAEAPTIAPGGRALYYHARRDGRFVIERVTRRNRP